MIQECFGFNLIGEKCVLSPVLHSVMTPDPSLPGSLVSYGMSLFVILHLGNR